MKQKLFIALFALIVSIGFTSQVKAQTLPSYNSTVTMKPFDLYPNTFYMAPGDATGVQDFIYGYYYTCYNRTGTYKGYWASGNVGYAIIQVTVGGNLYQFNYPLYSFSTFTNQYTYFVQ